MSIRQLVWLSRPQQECFWFSSFLQKMNEFVFNSLWGWWYLILIWHHFWQCDLIFIWIHYIYDLSQHCVTSALIDIFQMPLARYIAYNIPTNQPILKRINHSMKRPGAWWYLSSRAFAGRARIKFTLQVIISGMSMIHPTFCITTKKQEVDNWRMDCLPWPVLPH